MKNHEKKIILDITDVAEDVKDIIGGGPVPTHINQSGLYCFYSISNSSSRI